MKRLEQELHTLKDTKKRTSAREPETLIEADSAARKARSQKTPQSPAEEAVQVATGIRELAGALRKTIVSENLDSRVPATLSQTSKIICLSERLVNILGAKSATKTELPELEQQTTKIRELKRCLEAVKEQAAELERTCQQEKDRLRLEYTGKLDECNKTMREQAAELQRTRKQLDDSQQAVARVNVRIDRTRDRNGRRNWRTRSAGWKGRTRSWGNSSKARRSW